MGLFHLRHRNLSLLLLNFTTFLTAHSSSCWVSSLASPALQHASCIPQTCMPITCRGLIHASPSPRLLMKMKNRINLHVRFPGTSDCCQFSFLSLTTTAHPDLISSVKLCGCFSRVCQRVCYIWGKHPLLSTEPAISPQKKIRLFKHKMLSVNPSWLPRLQSSLRISQLH